MNQRQVLWSPNVRAVRARAVQDARARIFNDVEKKVGEHMFRRPLEGPRLNRHYFPSKFQFQSFHLDEYYDMQEARFDPEVVAYRRRQLWADDTADRTEWMQRMQRVLDKVQAARRRGVDLKAMLDEKTRAHVDLLFSSDPRKKRKETDVPATAQDVEIINVRSVLSRQEILELREVLAVADQMLPLEATTTCAGPDDTSSAAKNPPAAASRESCEEVAAVPLLAGGSQERVVGDADVSTAAPDSAGEVSGEQEDENGARSTENKAAKKLVRHRFVDPMYRRRRLKWLERFCRGLHRKKEKQYNPYYLTHPDEKPVWPDNLGSVTIRWPNPAA
ncbi:unnamed protein product [Amoebophrya sp. A120]|nr:unnamed protein product [Amoebophrya sp. A120]|eukprot:GSA120T00016565001.1